ncbi:type II secretion system minor pseudopilin GspI [Aliikangiella sp. IMCC44653]
MSAVKLQKCNRTLAKVSAFTLLEVLIAMVIFGMAVTMLLSSMNSQSRAHVGTSLKVVAHWVALNQMAQVRLEPEWPNVGVTRGTSEMRGHKWFWLQTVTKTTEKDLRQVEVEVRYNDKDELPTTRFVGFIANKNIEKTAADPNQARGGDRQGRGNDNRRGGNQRGGNDNSRGERK